jgi:hypothetical protein
MNPIKYEDDICAWSSHMVHLLQQQQFNQLTPNDLQHLIDEIADVGKSEQRELISRMAVLLAHLLKWCYQPQFRSNSWRNTIKHQRKMVLLALRQTPSLKNKLQDNDWLEDAWLHGLTLAEKETGLTDLPEAWVWTIDEVLNDMFYPV